MWFPSTAVSDRASKKPRLATVLVLVWEPAFVEGSGLGSCMASASAEGCRRVGSKQRVSGRRQQAGGQAACLPRWPYKQAVTKGPAYALKYAAECWVSYFGLFIIYSAPSELCILSSTPHWFNFCFSFSLSLLCNPTPLAMPVLKYTRDVSPLRSAFLEGTTILMSNSSLILKREREKEREAGLFLAHHSA